MKNYIGKKLARAPTGVDTFVYLVLTPELLPFNNQFPSPLLHVNLIVPVPVIAVEWAFKCLKLPQEPGRTI